MEPDKRATWTRLLEGFDPARFGYRQAEVHVRRKVEVTFSSARGSFVVWLAPVGADTGFFRQTARFRIGYGGDPPDARGFDLLHDVCARVAANEAAISEREWRDFFVVQSDPDEFAMTGDRILEIRVVRACNERCPFCNSAPFADNVVAADGVAAAIRGAKALGAVEVSLTGGEPTLVPELPDWIRLARECGLRVTLQTNGVVAGSPGYWDRFRDEDGRLAVPDGILLSFHTRHPERLPALTGVGGTFDRKVAAVVAARALGIRVFLNFVVCTLNLDELPEFPAFIAATFGPGVSVVFSVAAPTGRAEDLALIPPVRNVAGPLAAALDEAVRLGVEAIVPEICGVPLCIAPAHSRHFMAMSRTTPVQALERDRVKAPACGECVHDFRCVGIWRAYADRHGLAEFTAVRAAPSGTGGA